MKLKLIKQIVSGRKMKYISLLSQRNQERTALISRKKRLDSSLQAQEILQRLAKNVQQQAHKQIASVVTKCLRAIFPDPYTFKIIFERKRGKTEANLVLYRDGLLLEDPLNETSGGVVDVAAFALRLACLIFAKPAKRRLLCLDEPFKMVDADNAARIGDLLMSLSEELKLQIILVTHNENLQIGKVIQL